MLPLVSLLCTVVSKGAGILSAQFFNNSMRGVLGEGGGIYHAIIGTLIITACAAIISVPIGVLTADLPRRVRQGQPARAASSPSWST